MLPAIADVKSDDIGTSSIRSVGYKLEVSLTDLAGVSADHGVVSRVAQPGALGLDRCVHSTYLDRSPPNYEMARWLLCLHRASSPLDECLVRQRTITRFHQKENTMTRLTQAVQSFVRRDEGQDLLEYALLIALIALVAVSAVTAAGVNVEAIFNQIAAAI